MSPTPLFDAALDKILDELKPHTRTCAETGETFEIGEKDIEMCKLLRVPPPKTIWWARIRQKRHFMGGFDLFRRTLPDGQSVVTMFDPESFAKILPVPAWNSDAFDPMAFGFSKTSEQSFFEAWRSLSAAVPRPALIQDPSSVNSDWSTYGWAMKNCYFTYEGIFNEDLQYADFMAWTSNNADAMNNAHSEWRYETVDCKYCSRTIFSERCEACIDIAFCAACKDCSDCFGCTNLRHKKFCFLNEQLTEEEYRKRVLAIDLRDAQVVEEWRDRIAPLWTEAFRLASLVLRSENVSGDDIQDSRDTIGVLLYSCERVSYAFGCTNCKDSANITSCMNSERCTNTLKVFDSYDVKHSLHCTGCVEVEYSELLTSCEYCFGCIGLKHKRFCILNKQYTEEEYWPLVDAIKMAMLERGEYGEFFPHAASPFAFNTSGISTLYPFTKEESEKLGVRWHVFTELGNASAVSIDELPTNLKDTTDVILSKRFLCPITGRSFGFVKPELALHRLLNVALPRVHPTVRRMQRAAQYLAPRLYPRACTSCHANVVTRLSPEKTTPVLCETCYEEVVIGEKEAPVSV